MEFTRCTLTCSGSNVFSGSGTVIVTLHEFNHLISNSGAGELGTGVSEIVLDGINFTNLPKAMATTLSGHGYLVVDNGAVTGTMDVT